jgi:hypothetical protein
MIVLVTYDLFAVLVFAYTIYECQEESEKFTTFLINLQYMVMTAFSVCLHISFSYLPRLNMKLLSTLFFLINTDYEQRADFCDVL